MTTLRLSYRPATSFLLLRPHSRKEKVGASEKRHYLNFIRFKNFVSEIA
jgi:hypothetical protein